MRQLLRETAPGVPLVRAFVFAAQALRFRMHHDHRFRLRQHLADYPAWRESQRLRRSPLAERRPWLTFGAIRFLEARLDRSMRVFEYGSGGSTIFFAERAGEVVAVEHERDWQVTVQRAIEAAGLSNARVVLAEPSPAGAEARNAAAADPGAYASSDTRYAGSSFRAYAATIDAWPDDAFDVIVIDGRARPSAFVHARPKLAPGGLLVLDNAERAHYASILHTLDTLGWRRHEFAGAGPYNRYFWKTFAWERPRP